MSKGYNSHVYTAEWFGQAVYALCDNAYSTQELCLADSCKRLVVVRNDVEINSIITDIYDVKTYR